MTNTHCQLCTIPGGACHRHLPADPRRLSPGGRILADMLYRRSLGRAGLGTFSLSDAIAHRAEWSN